jgi:predicted Zn-dependent peptidase
MYKFKLTKLNNGLRVLTVPSKESLSFQITVLVNTGADFETKENNGISHFLEHMCFKGTKKRPSNFAIVQELDNIGGSYSAFTSTECTGYYAEVAHQNKELALDVVSDIYLNSEFPEKEMKKEKGVIVEEINTYKDNPQAYIWDLWEKLLYGDQAVGRSISGTKTNIKGFKREDFLKYYKSQYKAKSTIVVASGNFPEKETINQIKGYFSDIRPGKSRKKELVKENQNKPQVLIKNKKTDQTHLVLGVRGISLFDKRFYALKVLDAIFDGGMSGILFQTIREKLGAAYYINSNLSYSTDHGFWAISAGIDNNRLEEVILSILNEWKKFKIKLVDIKDIKKAKRYITGKLALGLENVHNVASYFGFEELLKRKIETPDQYLKKIKQVTSRDLQKVAQDLLKPQSLNLTLIGPHKNKEKLQKLLSNF